MLLVISFVCIAFKIYINIYICICEDFLGQGTGPNVSNSGSGYMCHILTFVVQYP